MIITYTRTTTGWTATVNDIVKWFIKYANDGKYDVYEVVDKNNGCLLRTTAADLARAKTYVSLNATA